MRKTLFLILVTLGLVGLASPLMAFKGKVPEPYSEILIDTSWSGGDYTVESGFAEYGNIYVGWVPGGGDPAPLIGFRSPELVVERAEAPNDVLFTVSFNVPRPSGQEHLWMPDGKKYKGPYRATIPALPAGKYRIYIGSGYRGGGVGGDGYFLNEILPMTGTTNNPVDPNQLFLYSKEFPATASLTATPTAVGLGGSVTLALGQTEQAASGLHVDGPGLPGGQVLEPPASVSVTPTSVGTASYSYTVPGGHAQLTWVSNSPTGTFTLNLPGGGTLDVTGRANFDVTEPGVYTITQRNTVSAETSPALRVQLPDAVATAQVAVVAPLSGSVAAAPSSMPPTASITASPDNGTVSLNTTIAWNLTNAGSFVVEKDGVAWASSGIQKLDTVPVGTYTYKVTAQPSAAGGQVQWTISSATGAVSARVVGQGFDSGPIAVTVGVPGGVAVPASGTYTVTLSDAYSSQTSSVNVTLAPPASSQVTVTVTKGTQSIAVTPSPIVNVAPTDPITLTASGSQTGVYVWSGSSGVIGTGSSKTFTPPTIEGTYTAEVISTGNASYFDSNTVTVQIVVARIPQAPLVLQAGSPLIYQATEGMTTTGGSGGGAVTYAIVAQSTPSVAVIESGTVLRALSGTGWVDVQATKAGDVKYLPQTSAVVRVALTKADQSIGLIYNSPMTYGTTQTLRAGGYSGTGSVSYAIDSEDTPGRVSLTGDALRALTGLPTAWAMVRVSIAADANYNAATDLERVRFRRASQSDYADLVLHASTPQSFNTTQTLTTTGGAGTGAVSFAITGSSSGGVGTLTGDQLHANTGTGWVELQATKAGDDNFDPISSSVVRVDFVRIAQNVSLSPTSALVAPGDAIDFTASGARTSLVWGGLAVGQSTAAIHLISPGIEGNYQVTVYAAADANYDASPMQTASVAVVPTQMTAFVPLTSDYTVTAEGPNHGKTFKRVWYNNGWNCYLGRSGTRFSLTGRGTHKVVQFELQAKDTSANAEWVTIAAGAPSEQMPNGSGVNVQNTFSVRLGEVSGKSALVPLSFEKGAALVGTWQFQARVQDSDGRWSAWTAVLPVNVVLPLTTTQVTAKTVPPAGPLGAWFKESEEKTYPFNIWIP